MRYLVCVTMLYAAHASHVSAQSNPLYVSFSQSPADWTAKGALYSPDSGPKPHVAILAIHRTANFMSYYGCAELSARGYLVLCMNPRSDNNEAAVRWEDNPLDIKMGMEFLREQPGIQSVLLWGFSGGGATTSFYQAVAESGISYCQGPDKLMECASDLAELPPTDGLILVDANHGIAHGAVREINGAVINDAEIIGENKSPVMDASLDPFSPANGYNPDGASSYSEEFQQRYFEAQADRMTRLIELARAKLRAIEMRSDPYPDDDVFIVVKGRRAELMLPDPSIHHSTLKPQKLLRNDGTIVRQIVESVRLPNPGLAEENASFSSGTRLLTLRSFLSANAMRATNSMSGLDYCSTNNSVPCAVQSISVPLLITAMGANRYLRFNEIHFELAKSEDKDFVVIEGATHGHRPCVACESSPGQYSNATVNFFDHVRDWINERY